MQSPLTGAQHGRVGWGLGAARLLGTLSRAAGCSWLWTQPSFEGEGSVLPVTPRPLSELTDDTCPMLASEPAYSGQTVPCQTRVRLSVPCQTSRFWGSHLTSLVGR